MRGERKSEGKQIIHLSEILVSSIQLAPQRGEWVRLVGFDLDPGYS